MEQQETQQLEYVTEGEEKELQQDTSVPQETHRRYDMLDPKQLDQLARKLREHVDNHNLTQEIAGKNYILVEAWQYIGRLQGFVPTVLEFENLSNYQNQYPLYRYQVKVALYDINTQQYISTAWAICSNKESKKKSLDEYAIASMAQTRAIGKVCRNVFGFLASVGDENDTKYEATPAEEMYDTKETLPPVTNEVVQNQIIPTIKEGKINEARAIMDQYYISKKVMQKLERGIEQYANQDVNTSEIDKALQQTPEQKPEKDKKKAAEAIKEQ